MASIRGYPVDRLTQQWVQATGRRVVLADHPWLDGPTGDPQRIGHDFFETLAQTEGLLIADGAGAPRGLMPSFAALGSADFDPSAVAPEIRRFYERTSEYALEFGARWSAPFLPFGRALAWIFSRRLQQLNVPLARAGRSAGLTSAIVVLEDPHGGRVHHTAWIRRDPRSGATIYAASYSHTGLPGHAAQFVKVVFPLPNGYAMVLMRPVARADGSLLLVSRGSGFGDPGFYFLVRAPDGRAWVRYVRTFHETIHVVLDADGALRADHDFHIWRRRFLRLRYDVRHAGS